MKKHFRERENNKNTWQIQEAKAKFSLLVENANTNGSQIITKYGQSIAVILSKREFDKMTQSKTSFLNFFKASPCQEDDFCI